MGDSRRLRNFLRAYEWQRSQHRIPGDTTARRTTTTVVNNVSGLQTALNPSLLAVPAQLPLQFVSHPQQGDLALCAAVAPRCAARSWQRAPSLRFPMWAAPACTSPAHTNTTRCIRFPPAESLRPGQVITADDCGLSFDQSQRPSYCDRERGYRQPSYDHRHLGQQSRRCLRQQCQSLPSLSRHRQHQRKDQTGSSNYNALEASLRHSIGGLELNVAYTYSHSIDDSSDYNDTGFREFLQSQRLPGQLQLRSAPQFSSPTFTTCRFSRERPSSLTSSWAAGSGPASP